MDTDRAKVLLRAVYDLLTREDRSHGEISVLYRFAHYDEANCDGYCLRGEIADLLGIDEDTDPIPLTEGD